MDFWRIFKRESLPSFSSGTIAVAAASPLEVLKIQAQCTGSDRTIRQLARNIISKHGYPGFYKGMVASLIAQPAYWVGFFPLYHYIGDRYKKEDGSMDLHHKMFTVFIARCVNNFFSVQIFNTIGHLYIFVKILY